MQRSVETHEEHFFAARHLGFEGRRHVLFIPIAEGTRKRLRQRFVRLNCFGFPGRRDPAYPTRDENCLRWQPHPPVSIFACDS